MLPHYITEEKLDAFIGNAIAEDVGDGDHSTLASIPTDSFNTAKLSVKDDGILAGIELARRIFLRLDPEMKFEAFKKDGDKVAKGDIAFEVSGRVHTILKAERLVLNCMQRMCGIATLTNLMCEEIAHTHARLLDTRKTTPNYRIIEKWAVLIGGGVNHRFGLFDMIILKDNHVDYAGGIRNALVRTSEYLVKNQLQLKVIIETRNLEEVQQALDTGGFDRIMLDNMDTDLLTKAVQLIGGTCETEASGGVNRQTIKSIAETGVDFISVGALTHSARSLDLSLKAMVKR